MKIELNIQERLLISTLYPQKSSLKNQIVVRDIKEKVKISQDELTKYDIKENNGVITWNQGKVENKVIDFTQMEIDLLKNQISEADKKNEITQNLVELCLKLQKSES